MKREKHKDWKHGGGMAAERGAHPRAQSTAEKGAMAAFRMKIAKSQPFNGQAVFCRSQPNAPSAWLANLATASMWASTQPP